MVLSREEASTVEHVEERARGKGGGGARAAGGANTKKPSTFPIVRQAQERREAARDVLAVPNSICRRGRLLPISPIADECVYVFSLFSLAPLPACRRFDLNFWGSFPLVMFFPLNLFIYSAWMALLITGAPARDGWGRGDACSPNYLSLAGTHYVASRISWRGASGCGVHCFRYRRRRRLRVQHILCSIEFFHHEHAQHQRCGARRRWRRRSAAEVRRRRQRGRNHHHHQQ